MVRTQIQLTEQQARALRRMVRAQGISMAEVVRRCLEAGMGAERSDRASRYERAARVLGRFRDRGAARDVSTHHDRYLDEALG